MTFSGHPHHISMDPLSECRRVVVFMGCEDLLNDVNRLPPRPHLSTPSCTGCRDAARPVSIQSVRTCPPPTRFSWLGISGIPMTHATSSNPSSRIEFDSLSEAGMLSLGTFASYPSKG